MSGCTTDEYLELLQTRLPAFIESVGQSKQVGLAIYNAGTDIYEGDALGGLRVSAEGVLKRDLFVLEELRRRAIPTVMLPSGGYSEESHRMIARTIQHLLEKNL